MIAETFLTVLYIAPQNQTSMRPRIWARLVGASGDKLATVGFRGLKANNTRFFWPIWSHPVGLDTLHSVLSLRTLGTSEEMEIAELQTIGIEVVYRCRRILVGKTPNLTAPEPVLTN